MPKKNKSIPVNNMADVFGTGIAIGRASVDDLSNFAEADLLAFDKARISHRDDYHIFFLQENGTISIEIDFQQYTIEPFSVSYMHPNQVHRMRGEPKGVAASYLAISNEDLKPENLKLLEDIKPTPPLPLQEDIFSLISDAVSLCIKISERKHDRLYRPLLKDSCNTLVALIASQFLDQTRSSHNLSRYELITRAFKSLLEQNFITAKTASGYADTLNISTSYLNECVKNSTGYSVSHHIQQRIILEAKRLLYHSAKSVKEISFELGYEDYPYFSRLFSKVTGITPLSFRNTNRD
jgi:AraC family transcriptional activator of pobA